MTTNPATNGICDQCQAVGPRVYLSIGYTVCATCAEKLTPKKATRMGCSACGDDVPATRTPSGWLCEDCRRDR